MDGDPRQDPAYRATLLPNLVSSWMPPGLDALQSSASGEGVKNVAKLIQDWNLGQTLFDGMGECPFIAQVNKQTVGVGGVLKCKNVPGVLRVSRFYVLPEWRKKGIARAIAEEALIRAREFADVITCNAQASELAAPFWESLGFTKVNIPGITHEFPSSGHGISRISR